MSLMVLFLALNLKAIPPVLAVDSQPIGGDTSRGFEVPTQWPAEAGEALLDGLWRLEWDDTVGDELTGEVKSCELRLRVIGGVLSGEFVGSVAGTHRNAIIEGQFHGTQFHEPSEGGVLNFWQREAGYVCSYQLAATPESVAGAVGVWCDSKGRSGNFRLLCHQ